MGFLWWWRVLHVASALDQMGTVGFIQWGRVLHAASASVSSRMVAAGFIHMRRFGVVDVGLDKYSRWGEASYDIDLASLASDQ